MMSCSYFLIKEPFTSIKTRDLPEDNTSEISLYIGDKVVGQIVVLQIDQYDVLRMFFNDKRPVMVTYAKPHRGLGLYKYADLEPEQQLISEYGDLVTVREVLERLE